MTTRLSLLLFLSFSFVYLSAQSNPTFDSFIGTVYKIPEKDLHLQYTYSEKKALNYEIVDTIQWERLHIPDSDIDTFPFPNVSLRKAFAILFKSTMHISQAGMYGFALRSDDGSILWIGEDKVVNNDKPHKMQAKTGKRYLKKGSYPITIWYFQAYLPRFGIEFSSKLLASSPEKQTIILNNESLFFPTNSHSIDEKGLSTLEELMQQFQTKNIRKITIIGHTDNIGKEADNLSLSTNRAIAVSTQLRKLFANQPIEFSVLGKGEQQPIADNLTEEGRQKNRRVEIIVE